MYMCMYARMHVCMYVCMYVSQCVCMRGYIHASFNQMHSNLLIHAFNHPNIHFIYCILTRYLCREEKVKEIRIHLESAARELSIERFSSFESSLFQTIFSFVDSNDLLCKKAGIRVSLSLSLSLLLLLLPLLLL